jgi:nicotinamide mononucleotide transporter
LTFSPLEIAAFLVTAVNVWLAVKENIWTWPAGIVSVILFFVYFWQQGLYLNAALQVVYFVLSIHGWYEWLHGGVNRTERRIAYASRLTWAVTMPLGVALTFVLLGLEQHYTKTASLPVWDAVTTAFSLVGQYMLNMKIIENWLIWAAVDVIYVFIFIDQKSPLFTALYAFFIYLCVKGYVDWRRSLLAASA